MRAVAQAVQTVRHDFATAHICTARLTLQLRNCLLHRASISVEAGHLQPNSLTAREHSRLPHLHLQRWSACSCSCWVV